MVHASTVHAWFRFCGFSLLALPIEECQYLHAVSSLKDCATRSAFALLPSAPAEHPRRPRKARTPRRANPTVEEDPESASALLRRGGQGHPLPILSLFARADASAAFRRGIAPKTQNPMLPEDRPQAPLVQELQSTRNVEKLLFKAPGRAGFGARTPCSCSPSGRFEDHGCSGKEVKID